MRNKNLIYTIILLVVFGVGAGIYFTREDISSLKYKTFKHNSFSVDYPETFWTITAKNKAVNGATFELSEKLMVLEKANSSEKCIFSISKVKRESLGKTKDFNETLVEGSMSLASGFKGTMHKSEIIEDEKSKKYIANFDYVDNSGFVTDAPEHKQWLAVVNCGTSGYKITIDCPIQSAKKENDWIFNHVVDSLYCEAEDSLISKKEEEEWKMLQIRRERIKKLNTSIVVSSMEFIQMLVNNYYRWDIHDSYPEFSCDTKIDNIEIRPYCDSVAENAGMYEDMEPIIHSSKEAYCIYVQLPEGLPTGDYHCVDSQKSSKTTVFPEGNSISTQINPSGKGYCDGITFVCPSRKD